MRNYIVLTLLVLIIGCRTINKTPSNKENESAHNNVVAVDSDNTISNHDSRDKVIFEGTNNLFELVQKNSKYFDQKHDVIIIKGNNSIIRLVNINVLNLSKDQNDTLIFVGEKIRYIVDVDNSIYSGGQSVKTDTIYLKEQKFSHSALINDLVNKKLEIQLTFFDSLVTAEYAHSFFLGKLSTDSSIYFYELAEMYLYGIGVQVSQAKAIDLYEYAAAKDHIPSIIKLGDIYSGKFLSVSNRQRALYYYRRCDGLGNQYCNEKLKEMLHR